MTHSIAYELLHEWRKCDGCPTLCLESTMLMRTRSEEVDGRVRHSSLWLCAECDALYPATVQAGADLDNPQTWLKEHE